MLSLGVCTGSGALFVWGRLVGFWGCFAGGWGWMPGPAPKDPAKRARRNKDVAPVRYIQPPRVVEKPDLPEFDVEIKVDGEAVMVPFSWPTATRGWWELLDFHPLVNEFFDTDWSYLLDTARIHAAFWSGNMSLAGELRLREAKYGFTPEDRAKLRIFTATAVESESKAVEAVEKTVSARDRMRGVTRKEA